MTDAGLSPHDRAHTWATTPLSVIQSGDYHPGADTIQVMTMKVSKGLEFPVVALPGVGNMPAPGVDEMEAARVFYVAEIRAARPYGMGAGVHGSFFKQLTEA